MNNEQWQELATALKGCLNSHGTFWYDYDGGFSIVERYHPTNCLSGIYPRAVEFKTQSEAQSCAAVDNFVMAMANREQDCICANAQYFLGNDEQPGQSKVVSTIMRCEKRLLVRAVAEIQVTHEFPGGNEDRQTQADALFNLGRLAIEEFQRTPTGLILFPNLVLPDSRVLGGFFGSSPWSAMNNQSLKLKFRMMNPHFKMRLRTVAELGHCGEQRKVGVLFTYANPR